MSNIHDVQSREIAGRDMIARVYMQFQAAAFAALEILDGTEVDRVYCDYHDDFVVRRKNADGGVSYHFHQVKTNGKRNHLWTLAEVFALKKKGQKNDEESLKKIENSFAGRLFFHTIAFGHSCIAVTMLTNVQFHDDVEQLVEALQSGNLENRHALFLVDNFSGIFPKTNGDGRDKIMSAVEKISLLPGVVHTNLDDLDSFVTAARNAIYKYSEIDLSPQEIREIATNLISVVQKKSFAKISDVPKSALDEAVGVGLDDLLDILSISRSVYQALISGQDTSALKHASIIERKMKEAGASLEMTEYATRQKVKWDIWLRNARHTIPEYDLNILLNRVQNAQTTWARQGGKLDSLLEIVADLAADPKINQFNEVNNELLLGAILAALARVGTR